MNLPAVERAAMREVMGHFATGVVVVTAAGPDGPLGFTCQSFASLSLDPPLVCFAPARTSRTWPRIRAVGAFCINVLAADQERESMTFARSVAPGQDKFAGVRWHVGPGGAPVLAGVCAWVACGTHAEYDGGDHTIAVGRVHDLAADPTRAPLLYHRGGYGVSTTAQEPAGPLRPGEVPRPRPRDGQQGDGGGPEFADRA